MPGTHWQWKRTLGSRRGHLAVEEDTWQWKRTHWQWKRTLGSGRGHLAVEEDTWQWKRTLGSGRGHLAVEEDTWLSWSKVVVIVSECNRLTCADSIFVLSYLVLWSSFSVRFYDLVVSCSSWLYLIDEWLIRVSSFSSAVPSASSSTGVSV